MLINDYQCSSNETDSDSKIGSQLSTRDPEVGPYEFYCHLDAMLDISQKAIDQKKFNTMATSVLIDKYENVTFNDGDATMDATRYKSNSSNETKCFDDVDITCSELHKSQTDFNTIENSLS